MSLEQLRDEVIALQEENEAIRKTHAMCGGLRKRTEELSGVIVGMEKQLTKITQERDKWKSRCVMMGGQVQLGVGNPIGATSGGNMSCFQLYRDDFVASISTFVKTLTVQGKPEGMKGVLADAFQYVLSWVEFLNGTPGHADNESLDRLHELHQDIGRRVGAPEGGSATGKGFWLTDEIKVIVDSRRAIMKEIMKNRETIEKQVGPEKALSELAKERETLYKIIENDYDLVQELVVGKDPTTEKLLGQIKHWQTVYHQQRELVAKGQEEITALQMRVLTQHSSTNNAVQQAGLVPLSALTDLTRLHVESRSSLLQELQQLRMDLTRESVLPESVLTFHIAAEDSLLAQLRVDDDIMLTMCSGSLEGVKEFVAARNDRWRSMYTEQRRHITGLETEMVRAQQKVLDHTTIHLESRRALMHELQLMRDKVVPVNTLEDSERKLLLQHIETDEQIIKNFAKGQLSLEREFEKQQYWKSLYEDVKEQQLTIEAKIAARFKDKEEKDKLEIQRLNKHIHFAQHVLLWTRAVFGNTKRKNESLKTDLAALKDLHTATRNKMLIRTVQLMFARTPKKEVVAAPSIAIIEAQRQLLAHEKEVMGLEQALDEAKSTIEELTATNRKMEVQIRFQKAMLAKNGLQIQKPGSQASSPAHSPRSQHQSPAGSPKRGGPGVTIPQDSPAQSPKANDKSKQIAQVSVGPDTPGVVYVLPPPPPRPPTAASVIALPDSFYTTKSAKELQQTVRDLEAKVAKCDRIILQHAKVYFEGRTTMIAEIEGMKVGVAKVNAATAALALLDFHNQEVNSLIDQLKYDEALMITLITGSKNLEKEMEIQRHWKELYLKQRSHVEHLERENQSLTKAIASQQKAAKAKTTFQQVMTKTKISEPGGATNTAGDVETLKEKMSSLQISLADLSRVHAESRATLLSDVERMNKLVEETSQAAAPGSPRAMESQQDEKLEAQDLMKAFRGTMVKSLFDQLKADESVIMSLVQRDKDLEIVVKQEFHWKTLYLQQVDHVTRLERMVDRLQTVMEDQRKDFKAQIAKHVLKNKLAAMKAPDAGASEKVAAPTAETVAVMEELEAKLEKAEKFVAENSRMYVAARMALTADVQRMKDALLAKARPNMLGLDAVLEFQNAEVNALMEQIKSHETIIINLSSGTWVAINKDVERELATHKHWKDLYYTQRDHVEYLERKNSTLVDQTREAERRALIYKIQSLWSRAVSKSATEKFKAGVKPSVVAAATPAVNTVGPRTESAALQQVQDLTQQLAKAEQIISDMTNMLLDARKRTSTDVAKMKSIISATKKHKQISAGPTPPPSAQEDEEPQISIDFVEEFRLAEVQYLTDQTSLDENFMALLLRRLKDSSISEDVTEVDIVKNWKQLYLVQSGHVARLETTIDLLKSTVDTLAKDFRTQRQQMLLDEKSLKASIEEVQERANKAMAELRQQKKEASTSLEKLKKSFEDARQEMTKEINVLRQAAAPTKDPAKTTHTILVNFFHNEIRVLLNQLRYDEALLQGAPVLADIIPLRTQYEQLREHTNVLEKKLAEAAAGTPVTLHPEAAGGSKKGTLSVEDLKSIVKKIDDLRNEVHGPDIVMRFHKLQFQIFIDILTSSKQEGAFVSKEEFTRLCDRQNEQIWQLEQNLMGQPQDANAGILDLVNMRKTLVNEIQEMRDSLRLKNNEFTRLERTLLLHQLRYDDSLLEHFCSGNKAFSQEFSMQSHWKHLFLTQQEHLMKLEQRIAEEGVKPLVAQAPPNLTLNVDKYLLERSDFLKHTVELASQIPSTVSASELPEMVKNLRYSLNVMLFQTRSDENTIRTLMGMPLPGSGKVVTDDLTSSERWRNFYMHERESIEAMWHQHWSSHKQAQEVAAELIKLRRELQTFFDDVKSKLVKEGAPALEAKEVAMLRDQINRDDEVVSLLCDMEKKLNPVEVVEQHKAKKNDFIETYCKQLQKEIDDLRIQARLPALSELFTKIMDVSEDLRVSGWLQLHSWCCAQLLSGISIDSALETDVSKMNATVVKLKPVVQTDDGAAQTEPLLELMGSGGTSERIPEEAAVLIESRNQLLKDMQIMSVNVRTPYEYHRLEVEALLAQIRYDEKAILHLVSKSPQVGQQILEGIQAEGSWKALYTKQCQHVQDVERSAVRAASMSPPPPAPQIQYVYASPPPQPVPQYDPTGFTSHVPLADPSIVRRHAEGRQLLLQEMEKMRCLMSANVGETYGFEMVMDYHEAEVRALLEQIRCDDEVLFSGTNATYRMERETDQQRYWKGLYMRQRDYVAELERKVRRVISDAPPTDVVGNLKKAERTLSDQTRLHLESRQMLLNDMQKMYSAVSVQDPMNKNALELVLEFHHTEIKALMDQIKADEGIILSLVSGKQTVEREIEHQRYWKDLYARQREHTNQLEWQTVDIKRSLNQYIMKRNVRNVEVGPDSHEIADKMVGSDEPLGAYYPTIVQDSKKHVEEPSWKKVRNAQVETDLVKMRSIAMATIEVKTHNVGSMTVEATTAPGVPPKYHRSLGVNTSSGPTFTLVEKPSRKPAEEPSYTQEALRQAFAVVMEHGNTCDTSTDPIEELQYTAPVIHGYNPNLVTFGSAECLVEIAELNPVSNDDENEILPEVVIPISKAWKEPLVFPPQVQTTETATSMAVTNELGTDTIAAFVAEDMEKESLKRLDRISRPAALTTTSDMLSVKDSGSNPIDIEVTETAIGTEIFFADACVQASLIKRRGILMHTVDTSMSATNNISTQCSSILWTQEQEQRPFMKNRQTEADLPEKPKVLPQKSHMGVGTAHVVMKDHGCNPHSSKVPNAYSDSAQTDDIDNVTEGTDPPGPPEYASLSIQTEDVVNSDQGCDSVVILKSMGVGCNTVASEDRTVLASEYVAHMPSTALGESVSFEGVTMDQVVEMNAHTSVNKSRRKKKDGMSFNVSALLMMHAMVSKKDVSTNTHTLHPGLEVFYRATHNSPAIGFIAKVVQDEYKKEKKSIPFRVDVGFESKAASNHNPYSHPFLLMHYLVCCDEINPRNSPPPKPTQEIGGDATFADVKAVELDNDDEDEAQYRPGGYHRVLVGDVISNTYEVIRKLGWGEFGTVWLAKNIVNESWVTLKISKSEENHRVSTMLEGEIYETMRGSTCIGTISDRFEIQGPHGVHYVLVGEVLGPNILKLIQGHQYKGIAPNIVKTLTRYTLIGLHELHSVGYVHADLKPENVLLTMPSRHVLEEVCSEPLEIVCKRLEVSPNLLCGEYVRTAKEPLKKTLNRHYALKVADLGSCLSTHKPFTPFVFQTREYRSPEVILGSATLFLSSDLWSMACMVFELLTGEFLFDPKYQKTHDHDLYHIALILQLFPLTTFDLELLQSCKNYSKFFDSKHKFRGPTLERSTLCERLQTHGFSLSSALEIEDFLLPMLRWNPSARGASLDVLQHPWLQIIELSHCGTENMNTSLSKQSVHRDLQTATPIPEEVLVEMKGHKSTQATPTKEGTPVRSCSVGVQGFPEVEKADMSCHARGNTPNVQIDNSAQTYIPTSTKGVCTGSFLVQIPKYRPLMHTKSTDTEWPAKVSTGVDPMYYFPPGAPPFPILYTHAATNTDGTASFHSDGQGYRLLDVTMKQECTVGVNTDVQPTTANSDMREIVLWELQQLRQEANYSSQNTVPHDFPFVVKFHETESAMLLTAVELLERTMEHLGSGRNDLHEEFKQLVHFRKLYTKQKDQIGKLEKALADASLLNGDKTSVRKENDTHSLPEHSNANLNSQKGGWWDSPLRSDVVEYLLSLEMQKETSLCAQSSYVVQLMNAVLEADLGASVDNKGSNPYENNVQAFLALCREHLSKSLCANRGLTEVQHQVSDVVKQFYQNAPLRFHGSQLHVFEELIAMHKSERDMLLEVIDKLDVGNKRVENEWKELYIQLKDKIELMEAENAKLKSSLNDSVPKSVLLEELNPLQETVREKMLSSASSVHVPDMIEFHKMECRLLLTMATCNDWARDLSTDLVGGWKELYDVQCERVASLERKYNEWSELQVEVKSLKKKLKKASANAQATEGVAAISVSQELLDLRAKFLQSSPQPNMQQFVSTLIDYHDAERGLLFKYLAVMKSELDRLATVSAPSSEVADPIVATSDLRRLSSQRMAPVTPPHDPPKRQGSFTNTNHPSTPTITKKYQPYREAFDEFDVNRDGTINAKELHSALNSAGLPVTVDEASNMLRDLDKDGNGSITFDEFLTLLGVRTPPPSSKKPERKPTPNLFDSRNQTPLDDSNNNHNNNQSTAKPPPPASNPFDSRSQSASTKASKDESINTQSQAQGNPFDSRSTTVDPVRRKSSVTVRRKTPLGGNSNPFGTRTPSQVPSRESGTVTPKKIGTPPPLERPPSHQKKSNQEMDKYREAFSEFDINHDGTISAKELHSALNSAGMALTAEEASKMLRDMDMDGNGFVTFEEFIVCLGYKPSHPVRQPTPHSPSSTHSDRPLSRPRVVSPLTSDVPRTPKSVLPPLAPTVSAEISSSWKDLYVNQCAMVSRLEKENAVLKSQANEFVPKENVFHEILTLRDKVWEKNDSFDESLKDILKYHEMESELLIKIASTNEWIATCPPELFDKTLAVQRERIRVLEESTKTVQSKLEAVEKTVWKKNKVLLEAYEDIHSFYTTSHQVLFSMLFTEQDNQEESSSSLRLVKQYEARIKHLETSLLGLKEGALQEFKQVLNGISSFEKSEKLHPIVTHLTKSSDMLFNLVRDDGNAAMDKYKDLYISTRQRLARAEAELSRTLDEMDRCVTKASVIDEIEVFRAGVWKKNKVLLESMQDVHSFHEKEVRLLTAMVETSSARLFRGSGGGSRELPERRWSQRSKSTASSTASTPPLVTHPIAHDDGPPRVPFEVQLKEVVDSYQGRIFELEEQIAKLHGKGGSGGPGSLVDWQRHHEDMTRLIQKWNGQSDLTDLLASVLQQQMIAMKALVNGSSSASQEIAGVDSRLRDVVHSLRDQPPLRSPHNNNNASATTSLETHIEFKNAILEDMARLRDTVSTPTNLQGPLGQMYEFHIQERRTLLHILRADDKILRSVTKGHKSIQRDLDTQKAFQELYERQLEYVQDIERNKIAASQMSNTPQSIAPKIVVPAGDEGIRVVQEFYLKAQKELEVEKHQWRTRCLMAEEQLKTMESHVRSIEKEKQYVKRKQAQDEKVPRGK